MREVMCTKGVDIKDTEQKVNATSDEAKARYRAFEELLAPITVPPH